jgi:hypothetical protein
MRGKRDSCVWHKASSCELVMSHSKGDEITDWALYGLAYLGIPRENCQQYHGFGSGKLALSLLHRACSKVLKA